MDDMKMYVLCIHLDVRWLENLRTHLGTPNARNTLFWLNHILFWLVKKKISFLMINKVMTFVFNNSKKKFIHGLMNGEIWYKTDVSASFCHVNELGQLLVECLL